MSDRLVVIRQRLPGGRQLSKRNGKLAGVRTAPYILVQKRINGSRLSSLLDFDDSIVYNKVTISINKPFQVIFDFGSTVIINT